MAALPPAGQHRTTTPGVRSRLVVGGQIPSAPGRISRLVGVTAEQVRGHEGLGYHRRCQAVHTSSLRPETPAIITRQYQFIPPTRTLTTAVPSFNVPAPSPTPTITNAHHHAADICTAVPAKNVVQRYALSAEIAWRSERASLIPRTRRHVSRNDVAIVHMPSNIRDELATSRA